MLFIIYNLRLSVSYCMHKVTDHHLLCHFTVVVISLFFFFFFFVNEKQKNNNKSLLHCTKVIPIRTACVVYNIMHACITTKRWIEYWTWTGVTLFISDWCLFRVVGFRICLDIILSFSLRIYSFCSNLTSCLEPVDIPVSPLITTGLGFNLGCARDRKRSPKKKKKSGYSFVLLLCFSIFHICFTFRFLRLPLYHPPPSLSPSLSSLTHSSSSSCSILFFFFLIYTRLIYTHPTFTRVCPSFICLTMERSSHYRYIVPDPSATSEGSPLLDELMGSSSQGKKRVPTACLACKKTKRKVSTAR